MKKIYYILLGITYSLLLTNCSSLYIPTTPNIPLFKKGNEFQLEATASLNGVNGKSAYSPFKHFALQCNAQYVIEPYVLDSIRKGHNYYEGAGGTYFCLRNRTILEFYGGYGLGSSTYGDPLFIQEKYLQSAKGNYKKMYGQVNLGNHKWIKNGACGLSVRSGNVRYTYDYANFKWLNGKTIDHYFIETYMFVSKQINKRISLVGYYGFTLIQGLTTQGYKATMRTGITNTGVGFRLTIGRKEEVAKSE